MTSEAAKVFLAAARASGDQFFLALASVRNEVSPEEFAWWSAAVGRVLGTVYEELVEPICDAHPQIVPKALGGAAQD